MVSFALGFSRLDGIVYDALGFVFRRADLGFGRACGFRRPGKNRAPRNSSSNKDQQHSDN